MARTERDHAGREITEEAVRIAGLEYDQDLQEGDVPFAQLDRADQIRYTKAAIAFNDEVLSAQQLMRVFGEIADGARQQASQPQRAVEEAGAVAQVQGAVPARDAGETRQETGAREEVTDAVDSATAGFGEGNRYSKRADAESSLLRAVEQWKEVVAELAAGVLDTKRYPTLFASTPASMQVLGIPDLPVLAKFHMLNYLNQRFTRGQLENLPQEMADPVTVLMHEETDGTLSFNFVTRDTSANGYITVAVQPNSNDPRGGHANYTATVVTLPQRTILRELREGRAAYVGDLSAVEGAAAAFRQGKRESGKEAVKFRESISRKFRLPAALKKVAYKSDLVKLIEDGRAQYSRTSSTQGTTVKAVRSAVNAIATPQGKRKVTIYQSADEAVQSGTINSKDAKGTQGWVDSKGNAFFIADNIPEGSELAVVLHEIGTHIGIENLLTDEQFETLVKKIFDWAKSRIGNSTA